MIALPSTSQVKYTLNGESYTCYTPDENRAIATLILKGERDSVLLENSYKTIEVLEAEVATLMVKNDTNLEMIKLLKRDYQKLYEVSTEQVFQNNRLKTALKGTGLLSATLIVLMIL